MRIEQLSTEIETILTRARASVVQVRGEERGAGAGIVWREAGAILTNWHVVAQQRTLEVELADGTLFPATVVNQNPPLDLALLQVEASGLPAALVEERPPRVGELVFALGHPWGQPYVATMGLISGIGEVTVTREREPARYLRSDVRLAPGNSGGPLLNARGAVVGINAMIFGGDLAVAIPSTVASEWVAGLPSRRVRLGVTVQAVVLPPALQATAAQSAGLLVTAATRTPELFVGDLLLDVAGAPVGDEQALAHALGHRAATERVRLRLLRGGAVQAVEVEVGALEAL